MRVFSTLAYALAAALVFVAVASTLIGRPNPDDAPHGGLTTATILRSDGSRADAPAPRDEAARDERPSS
jgi:hypothetical protein